MSVAQDNLVALIGEAATELAEAKRARLRFLGTYGPADDRAGMRAHMKRVDDLKAEIAGYERLLGETFNDADGA